MMLLHGINDNIPISHPSYLVVYQEKQEMREIYKVIDFVFGSEPNQKKTDKTAVHLSLSALVKKSSHLAIEWVMGLVGL